MHMHLWHAGRRAAPKVRVSGSVDHIHALEVDGRHVVGISPCQAGVEKPWKRRPSGSASPAVSPDFNRPFRAFHAAKVARQNEVCAQSGEADSSHTSAASSARRPRAEQQESERDWQLRHWSLHERRVSVLAQEPCRLHLDANPLAYLNAPEFLASAASDQSLKFRTQLRRLDDRGGALEAAGIVRVTSGAPSAASASSTATNTPSGIAGAHHASTMWGSASPGHEGEKDEEEEVLLQILADVSSRAPHIYV